MTKSTKNSCATVTPRGSEIGRRKGSPVARVARDERRRVLLTHGIVYPSGTLAEPLDAFRPSCKGAAYPIGDQCLVKIMVRPDAAASAATARSDRLRSPHWRSAPR